MTCQLLDLNILLFKNLRIKIYKIVILCILWYRCDAWSLTLRDKHREYLIALHVTMYLFVQSQKSKQTKYAVCREKTLTICNQSCTVLTQLHHYQSPWFIFKHISVELQQSWTLFITSYSTQDSECQN